MATTTPREHLPLLVRSVNLLIDNTAVLLPALAAILAVGLVSIGVSFASQFAQVAAPDTAGMLSFATSILSLLIALVQAYLSIGFVEMLLALDRGEETSTDVMLEQMPRFGSVLLAFLLLAVVMVPVVLVWMAAVSVVPGVTYLLFGADSMAVLLGAFFATTLWALLLLSPLLYVTGGLSYVLPLIVDRDVNPVEALTTSWELTAGHRIFLVGQQWIVLLIVSLCYVFSCGLAAPFLTLLQISLQVATYNAIRAHEGV